MVKRRTPNPLIARSTRATTAIRVQFNGRMRGLGPCDVDSISTTLTMKYKINDIRIHQNLRDIVVRIDYTIDGEEGKFISKSI